MDTLGIFLVLVAIVGTALQGGSCMLSEDRPLSVGFLDLCLCILISCLAIFSCSGALVIAPEFGMIMVQGEGATWFLRLALVVAGILPILCWCRIRELNRSSVNLWPYLVVGIGIGVWAASRTHFLNPHDLVPLQVRVYDVWWPPLVVWFVYCLANIMLALAATRTGTLAASLGLGAAMVAPLGRFALVHQELFDTQSRAFWTILEPSSLLLAILFVARRYSDFGFAKRRPKLALAGFLLMEILAGILFVHAGGLTKLIIDLILPVALLSSNFLAIFVLISGSNETGQEEPPQKRFIDQIKRVLSLFTSGYRLSGVIAAVSVLIIPACLIDLLSVGVWGRDLEIGILTFFWLSFSAKLASGVIHTLPQLFQHGVLHLPALGAVSAKGAARLQRFGIAIKNAGASFITGKAWDITARSIVVTVFALLGLIAVGEILNYGKLVVEPLQWKGEGEDKTKVADRVSAGVVNTLGEMRRELLPVLMISTPADQHSSGSRVQPAVLDNGAIEGAVAKGTDLKLSSNVEIPLSLIMSPLQRIIQWAFNIRVVKGSLHMTADGKHYVVLIDSDKGDTWKVYGDVSASRDEASSTSNNTESTLKEKDVEAQGQDSSDKGKGANEKPRDKKAWIDNTQAKSEDPDKKSEEGVTQESEGDDAKSQFDGLVCKDDQDDSNADALDKLINEAAFRIASSDPSFVAMGLTKNWQAYEYFHIGLQRWNCYQAYKHWTDLRTAIDFFRKSVMEDNTFAPAEYRLGIAMQTAGEPDGAIQAFKDSLDASPALVESRTAEAQSLAFYDTPYFPLPAIADYPQRPDRNAEARRVLAAVVVQDFTPANRLDIVQAYYGLCSNRYESEDQDYRIYQNKYYLMYFFCSRAQALYNRLPRLGRDDLPRKKLEASILFSLGDALNSHDPDESSFPIQELSSASKGSSSDPESTLWVCSSTAIDNLDLYKNGYPTRYVLHGSRLTGHALRYIRASLAAVPDDDYVLCAEASAIAYLTKDRKSVMKAMQKLESSASAHLLLARELADLAHRNAHGHMDYSSEPEFQSYRDVNMGLAEFYYESAVREFAWTIGLSPTDPNALNEYANTVWQWSLDEKIGKAGKYPTSYHSNSYRWEAEIHAREAIRQYRLRNDYVDRLVATDTLGEILLTQGRNEEAVHMLQQVGAAKFDFYGYDEFQWDLAQASICASKTPGSSDAAEKLQDAEKTLAGIQQHELNREMRMISTTPGALDPVRGQDRCYDSPDAWPSVYDHLSYDGVSFHSRPGCSSMVLVEARIEGALPPEILQGVSPNNLELTLYIWGDGVEQVNHFGGLTAELMPPAHAHRFYFAQLRDSRNSIQSPVISFDAPDDKNDSACPHGHIILNFKPSSVPSVQR